MSTKIFIAGSITVKHLDSKVKTRIDNILAQNFEIVVGDADGVDASIQAYLSLRGMRKVTVFCSDARPRNNIGNWAIECVPTKHAKGTRAFYTAKDIRMAEVANFGLMIWDAKSTGTLNNVIELLARKKKSVVFVNNEKIFQRISTVENLEELLSFMSEQDREKAEGKIQLSERIYLLKHQQIQMPA